MDTDWRIRAGWDPRAIRHQPCDLSTAAPSASCAMAIGSFGRPFASNPGWLERSGPGRSSSLAPLCESLSVRRLVMSMAIFSSSRRPGDVADGLGFWPCFVAWPSLSISFTWSCVLPCGRFATFGADVAVGRRSFPLVVISLEFIRASSSVTKRPIRDVFTSTVSSTPATACSGLHNRGR